MPNFNSYIDKIDINFWYNLCAENGKLHYYKKGEYFVRLGDTIRYWGIIKQGYFKYTVIDSDGNEHISGFAFPGTFVGDYLSATLQRPCMTNIVATTDVEVLTCSLEIINQIFNEDKELHLLFSDSLFHQAYVTYLDMHCLSPKERYIALLQRCPDILQNITLKELASFLNITPTYLSRIRKELTFENK